MSEQIQKTELEIIEEQERMLFPAACAIQHAIVYTGKIKFDKEYRLITYTEDYQNIQLYLNKAIADLNEIPSKKLHPYVYQHTFMPMLNQFNAFVSSIRLNKWQILSNKALGKTDCFADKDMIIEMGNSLTCTLCEVTKDFEIDQRFSVTQKFFDAQKKSDLTSKDVPSQKKDLDFDLKV